MVDATLRNQSVEPEVRQRLDDGGYEILSSAARLGATQRGRERESTPGRGQWNERRSQSPVLLPERMTGRNAPRAAETVSPMERLTGIAPSGPRGGRAREQQAALVEVEPAEPERRVPAVHELRDPVRRGRGTEEKPLRIYPFGVSRNRLEESIRSIRVAAVIVRSIKEADAVMTLKNYYRRRPQPLVEAEVNGTPVYVLRTNTQQQMESVLANVFEVSRSAPEPEKPSDPQLQAMEEAEAAITSVLDNTDAIELRPQSSYIRRLQHQMAERYNLRSRSRGQGADRRVEIYRGAD
jgi:hypothetical protein